MVRAGGVARVFHAPIEPGAPIRLDARAPVVEEQPEHVRPAHAVDDVRHPRNLVQLRRDRLHVRVGVALLG
ncbi:MAG: hypothetical protein DMG01_20710 [Acidobacteria bacterium]|nr:MAG: hypothetical protein DMG01_20710 [Acidobacteriota bacterium]